ncbi:putative F-box protein [Raphanus sativus]|uniref:F-box protein At5g62660 n=1 Tax=Raphanus sativus TaxID=3726 RepID=A0A6J0L2I9_RAPSA|nr:putative F-box protein At5g62660 [Raphanus sativus]XP_056858029.1 putative F-box protein At5g62660 [Raphanus sativus]KAJ4866052.1 putative F-box protein [Raphanus sativus]KAJ4877437.1 putative F-box protein [Raphanus sativus]
MVKYRSLISSIQWKKKWPKLKRRARGRTERTQRGDDHEITFDLMIEILTRLPAKSLMRFKCVSKLWSCLIPSRYFSNLYLTVASSPSRRARPLNLYMSLNVSLTWMRHYKCDSMELCHRPGKCELLSLRLSSSLSNIAESSLEPDLTFPGMGGYKMVSLRGLILYTVCRKACIYNPATRQSLILPAVKSNVFAQQEPNKHVFYFFGHDPVQDQYKIVCSIVVFSDYRVRITSEFWVFVLEPGGFWKRIEYDDQPHLRSRPGLCINGVIYYLAFNHTCRDNVYCFDVRSEKFHKIQAPHELSQFCKSFGFIEHGGKPAIFDYTHIKETGVSELWVLGLDGGTWSRKSLILQPCQRHLLDDINIKLIVHGTGQNNEVILAMPCPCYLLYYDLRKNDLRKVNINRATTRDACFKVLDKCESIMHLEI